MKTVNFQGEDMPQEEMDEIIRKKVESCTHPLLVLNRTQYNTDDLTWVFRRFLVYNLERRGEPNPSQQHRVRNACKLYVEVRHGPSDTGPAKDEKGRPWFTRLSRNTSKGKTIWPSASLCSQTESPSENEDRQARGLTQSEPHHRGVRASLATPFGVSVTLPRPVKSGKHTSRLDAISAMQTGSTMSLPAFVNAQLALRWLHLNHNVYGEWYGNKVYAQGTVPPKLLQLYERGLCEYPNDSFRIRFTYDRAPVPSVEEQLHNYMLEKSFALLDVRQQMAKKELSRCARHLEESKKSLLAAEKQLNNTQKYAHKANGDLTRLKLQGYERTREDKKPLFLTSDNGTK